MDDICWEGLDVSLSNLTPFMTSLENQRKRLSDEKWKVFVETDKKLKVWRYYLLQDPYTRWAFVKPRGYAGDAVLMDFAYKHTSVKHHIQDSSEIGKMVYKNTSNAPQSLSAVSRTKFIADLIEKRSTKDITVASVASGHGREYEYLPNNTLKKIIDVLAIDSDKVSINTLRSSSLADVNVTVVDRNVFRTRLDEFGSRDIVYSLGLFDYLNDESAVVVLENMCSCVSSGGAVVVANLHHEAANLGYCEAIMDWWMIPRSEENLMTLSKNVRNLNESWNVKIERIDCFCYLVIEAD